MAFVAVFFFGVFLTVFARGFSEATDFLAVFFLTVVFLAGLRVDFFFAVFFFATFFFATFFFTVFFFAVFFAVFFTFRVVEGAFFFAFFLGVARAESTESVDWAMSMPKTSERSAVASRFDLPL